MLINQRKSWDSD